VQPALASTKCLPIVYLPGASGRKTVWQGVAERLATRREPHFVEYPGLSDVRLDIPLQSVTELTHWVRSRLPERFDVVSLSMGSAIGLRLALEAPERVRSLVLVTAVGGVDARTLGGMDWRPSFVARRPDAPRWLVDDATDLTERLQEVRAPVQLVYGELDLIAPPTVGRHLLEHLPNAWLEIVQGATHDLEEEEPELLASLIERHLRR
jgi:pimeloyl-ACP methyl ester carboxylesterase